MWTTKAPTAKASLFINQLPYGATREDVASYFAEAALKSASALLPSVRLVLKDGKFTGTAFVDMSDWETLDAGLALHQTVFTCADGSTRKINVREAVSKAQLELLGERAKTKEAATPEKTPAQSVVQGELGRDRKGKVVVGEVDPQRKRKALEGAYLEARRELRDLACTCKTCDRPFVFTVAEQEFFAAQGWPIPRPRCKACSTSKKSGTKRAADPSAQHHRTDAPPKKPRLDAPPEKPPAGTSVGAGKAEATRSAKGGDGKGATKAGAGTKGVGRRNSPGDSQSTASVVTKQAASMTKQAAPMTKQAAPMTKQAAPMTKQAEPTTSICFLCGQMGHVAKACTVKSASTQELSAALKAARARENAQLLAARAQNPERNQPDDVADAEHAKNKKPVGFHRGRKEGKKGRA